MTRSTSSGTRQNLRVRCAIYTRKSSEEGLEQEFNSLQAQREACEAFINSQRHEGWVCLPQGYDDGGFSGATMDRPALQRLLADIAAGRVDTVVERGSVQSFLRGDDNLALIHCGWRLAAQRDSVMANDVDAHGGFSWLVPRPLPRGDPTHALFAGQSHSIPDNLMALLSPRRAWNCSPKIAALFPVRHILLLVHCPSKRGTMGRSLGHMRFQNTAPRPAGCLLSARMLTKAEWSQMSLRDPFRTIDGRFKIALASVRMRADPSRYG